jgi:hypothetical protein
LAIQSAEKWWFCWPKGAQPKNAKAFHSNDLAHQWARISGEDRLRTEAENAGFFGQNLQSGAQSGAVGLEIGDSDARLTAVLEAWPMLPEATKDEIAALAQSAGITTQ